MMHDGNSQPTPLSTTSSPALLRRTRRPAPCAQTHPRPVPTPPEGSS
ncbi:hypothetical protein I545_5970 [Mycobacterium kansasii 662]|uniref:Uncharacterized protein n=1 Tax=Mycobacterium kansasii 662 TaxID=1299326 RepID=X7YSI3_MYCKA|nr:hypothetical protein I545_5970 [Mycobacterium kansasii 662]